jgi:filamentous hemagglutinin family protein
MDERTPGPRHPDCVGKPFLWALLLTLVFCLITSSVGHAQVVTNITSSGLNTQVSQPITLPNGQTQYNITGGTRPGSGPNLFHSFGQFDVGRTAGINDIANFFNDTGAVTTNILGRVTTLGNISNIYGTIQTTGFGNANLFLMNPSGFVLGPNASLNVGGSVSFTTAQYIRLFDFVSTANFYANPANDGLANSILAIDPSAFEFLSAIPISYGFLTPPGPTETITVQGSALSVPEGQSISLVGGKVVIQGAQLQDGTLQPAQLSAPNGRILLATAASPGEFSAISLQPLQSADGARFTSSGFASLEAGSTINVHNTNTVWIKGGQLVLSVNDATLDTAGNTVEADTIVLGSGSLIKTFSSGTGSGPELQLAAPNVQMTGASVRSETEGSGRGGDITVTADHVTIAQQSQIAALTLGEGAGGNVSIQGLTASAAKSVKISGVSEVTSSTTSTEQSAGQSGGISITAKSFDLDGVSNVTSSSFGPGSNGNIIVSVQGASLSNGGSIRSTTNFSSAAGTTGGSITVQGLQGNGSPADSLILDRSGIVSETGGTGRLGDIEVHAKTVSLTNGAVIQAGTPTDFATAGNIRIEADSVDISGGSSISSHAFALDAGQVTITAANQFTLDHSSITTNTSSPTVGRGGDVVVNAGTASLTNGATIDSSTSGAGRSGDINILASESVTMTNRSTISASSTGSGNAGNITIKAGNQFAMTDSSITTSSDLSSGGQVTITAPEMVHLINSNIITSVAGSNTDTFGGNITIDPQFVILQNSQILAKANAGTGGDITITSNVFLADPSSVVDASSDLGVSGVVDIRSPVSNISGIIGRLPESVLAAQALLRAACAARLAESQVSSFVERGRDSIPIGPDGLLATPYLPPSSEPRTQMGAVPVDSGHESWVGSSRTSGVQVRRLVGQDPIPRVQLLSGDAACGS